MTVELFRRSKDHRVDRSDDRSAFTARVDMTDAFHDMGVAVTFIPTRDSCVAYAVTEEC